MKIIISLILLINFLHSKSRISSCLDYNNYSNHKKIDILIMGNSITTTSVHFKYNRAKNEEWQHSYGMAASEEDRDYVHLLHKFLSSKYNPKICILPLTDFETQIFSYDFDNLKNRVNFNADIYI